MQANMGEVDEQVIGHSVLNSGRSLSTMSSKSSEYSLQIVTVPTSCNNSTRESYNSKSINGSRSRSINVGSNAPANPIESWLPITESRNGNIFTSIFLLLCSGIGYQALFLPAAFVTLGWAWGIISLSLSFAWQLYTIWLLVHLHEPFPGTRQSRYLRLSIAAFGPKLGKLLTMFPVMYLSGGSCFMFIIVGGGAMQQFYNIICGGGATCEAKSLSGTEWFLVFACMAIVIAQLPNLNSIATVSLVGAITAVVYCTVIWVLPISKGRPSSVSYDSSEIAKTGMAGFRNISNAIGLIVLSFRGHNLVLEIQGTLPSNSKHPSHKKMWRAVLVSYLLIAICFFPIAVGAYWAYGNKVPANGGMLGKYLEFYGHNYSKLVKCLIHLMVIISCLCSFQIYAMPVFDNLELIYITKKQQPCPGWVRTCLRLFFGGLAFFMAVAFPFLPKLAIIMGGVALPVTFAYPCFMWISIKKPRAISAMWFLNWGLGCLGIALSVMLVVGAAWNFSDKGLKANFFNP